MERLLVAESFEPCLSVGERRYTYYRIYVDNYTISYMIIDDAPNDPVMEADEYVLTTKVVLKNPPLSSSSGDSCSMET